MAQGTKRHVSFKLKTQILSFHRNPCSFDCLPTPRRRWCRPDCGTPSGTAGPSTWTTTCSRGSTSNRCNNQFCTHWTICISQHKPHKNMLTLESNVAFENYVLCVIKFRIFRQIHFHFNQLLLISSLFPYWLAYRNVCQTCARLAQ